MTGTQRPESMRRRCRPSDQPSDRACDRVNTPFWAAATNGTSSPPGIGARAASRNVDMPRIQAPSVTGDQTRSTICGQPTDKPPI